MFTSQRQKVACIVFSMNMTNSSKKIKKVAKLVGFTDIEARQVKRYNPLTKKLMLLPEIGVKENRTELRKVPALSKCMKYVVLQIRFPQRICGSREDQADYWFVRDNELSKSPGHFI